MRIPKQFFYKSRAGSDYVDTENNYFEFNKDTEDAAKDESNNRSMSQSGEANNNARNPPIVPRLNLPRPDPNDQWREMLAQAQSYEDVSSSNQGNIESSS